MSMYDILFGHNPYTLVLLRVLNLTADDIPRLRDVEVIDGQIQVTTRAGGANRGDYKDTWRDLGRHPLYEGTEDDDSDSTYAYAYFRFPVAHAADLALISRSAYRGEPADAYHRIMEAVGMEIIAEMDPETGEIRRRLRVKEGPHAD